MQNRVKGDKRLKGKKLAVHKLIGLSAPTLLVLIVLILVIASSCLSPTYGELSTVVKVEGPGLIDPSETTAFNVSIIAENVEGLYGWELILLWNDTTNIECTTEYVNTEIWPDYQGPWVTDPIDNEKGEYHQSLTAKAPSEPVSGTFWLANLTFTVSATLEQVIAVNFTVTKPPGYDNYVLLNIQADEIPHAYQSYQITIIPEFTLTLLLVAMTISTIATIILKRRNK